MKSVITLDGGMGNELRQRLPNEAWSPFILESHAKTVVETHCDFIEAGAAVIETWNYSVTPYWLRGHHCSDIQATDLKTMMQTWERLTRQSVRLAKQARERCKAPHVKIAGSLPPMGATFDATEPVRCLKTGEPLNTKDFYTRLAQILHSEGVDIFLVETCPSISFALNAIRACRAASMTKPLWVSFVLNHTKPFPLCSGESIESAIKSVTSIQGVGSPEALLFNCSTAEAIDHAVAVTKASGFPGRIGGYGNRRTVRRRYGVEENSKKATGMVMGQGERVDLDPKGYAAVASGWIDVGATIVGGCCQIRPAHIKVLAEMAADRSKKMGGIDKKN